MKKTERQAIAEAIRKTAEVLREHPRRREVAGGAIVFGWATSNLQALAVAVERKDQRAIEWMIKNAAPPEDVFPKKEDDHVA